MTHYTQPEARHLAWRLKQANKTMGKQGQTIANLRGELARTREEHSKIDRGDLRRLERENGLLLEQHEIDQADIARLREKLDAAQQPNVNIENINIEKEN